MGLNSPQSWVTDAFHSDIDYIELERFLLRWLPLVASAEQRVRRISSMPKASPNTCWRGHSEAVSSILMCQRESHSDEA